MFYVASCSQKWTFVGFRAHLFIVCGYDSVVILDCSIAVSTYIVVKHNLIKIYLVFIALLFNSFLDQPTITKVKWGTIPPLYNLIFRSFKLLQVEYSRAINKSVIMK